ncbi:MAG: tRNA glutamyl-Q(34) synthetase GluQRS [Pseudomonadota bacterium]
MLRFAPSPNGPLHKGHALSLLANEAMAKALDTPMTVRMEDIDRSRARPHFEAAILDDIAWLGVAWQPPMRRQSEHFAAYEDALSRLRDADLIYPSFATRKEIAAAKATRWAGRDPDGAPRFAGDEAVIGPEETARRRAEDAPAAWRLRMDRALEAVGVQTFTEVDGLGGNPAQVATDPAAWGDVVLARKEVPTSYHLSVVVDDAAQAITHVVRGADLRPATAIHRLLQALLGLAAPAYHHHRLILCANGRKLSKSSGATSLAATRELQPDPAVMRTQLGYPTL